MKTKVDQKLVRITRDSAQRYCVAIAGIATEVICDCLAGCDGRGLRVSK